MSDAHDLGKPDAPGEWLIPVGITRRHWGTRRRGDSNWNHVEPTEPVLAGWRPADDSRLFRTQHPGRIQLNSPLA